MDILNPSIINIDGRLYCAYHRENDQYVDTSDVQNTPDVLWDDEPVCDSENTCSDVVKTPEGRCKIFVSVPTTFFKHIVGFKGGTKKRLEHETKTSINIPRNGCDGDITITGFDVKSITSAKNRIDLLVSSKRWKEPFTHFISIPLASNKIKSKFMEFQQSVLSDFSSDDGVDKSLFQNQDKLHLTVCTLVLLSNDEVERAINTLHKVYDDVYNDLFGGGAMEIQLSSLEYMNDDPAAVDVLYGKVRCLDDSDRLQVLADRLSEAFIEEGLSEKQYDRVKLHCTLMNTLFRKTDDRQRQTRKSFDASHILMKYQDFEFGNLTLNEIHLSERGSFSENGYYFATDKVEIS